MTMEATECPPIEDVSDDWCRVLRINVPAWYRDPEFIAWLNKERTRGLATWHKGGEPTEYSDVFVTYDHGEGSDSDMPERMWDEIKRVCEERHLDIGLIWLTNV